MKGIPRTDPADALAFYYSIISILSVLVLVYLVVLKGIFGSFSLQYVMKEYNERQDVTNRYYDLFTARNNLMYHIGWSKARGEIEERRSLIKDLIKLDKVDYFLYF